MDESPAMAPQIQTHASSSSGKLKAARMSMKRSGGGAPLERGAFLAARENEGWIGSGIVSSASRILTKSAAFLFQSMFKRQGLITASPPAAEDGDDVPPLEISIESGEQGGELVEPAADSKNALSAPLKAADLENILMEKDLSREECERYISLIQSKIMDTALQPGSSSPPPTEAFESTRTVFSPENKRSRNENMVDTSQALVPWEEELSFGPPPPITVERRVKFQQPRARSERWTPIQVPISGGRELLKKRATVLDDKGADASPPRASFSLRGPSLVPSPTLKRKPNSEAMDLTCFRSAAAPPKTRKPSLRLDMPCSIPGQSSRTAQKILDTLERRSAFKNPDPDVSTRPTSEAPAPRRSRARVPALSAALPPPSGFSFPSTAHGPEPPTPTPIPSPYAQERKTSMVAPPNHLKNGLLPSFQETSFEKLPNPFGNGLDSFYSGEEAFDRFAERVEKASSFLTGAGASPALTVSPSFSDGVFGFQASTAGGFETGSSGRRREETTAAAAAVNPFQIFGGTSLTTTTTTTVAPTTLTTTTSAAQTGGGFTGNYEVKESSGLFEAWKSPSSSLSDQFWVGAAQSLAPPDTNPAALTPSTANGGVSLAAKRKKSSKRLK